MQAALKSSLNLARPPRSASMRASSLAPGWPPPPFFYPPVGAFRLRECWDDPRPAWTVRDGEPSGRAAFKGSLTKIDDCGLLDGRQPSERGSGARFLTSAAPYGANPGGAHLTLSAADRMAKPINKATKPKMVHCPFQLSGIQESEVIAMSAAPITIAITPLVDISFLRYSFSLSRTNLRIGNPHRRHSSMRQ